MDPDEYITALDEPRRGDIRALDALIRETLPDFDRHMRSGMLGYGSYHYHYASGREGESAIVALASQKRYISLYVSCLKDGAYLAESYVERLPTASIGKSCVRFRRLADVDLDVVRQLLADAGRHTPPGYVPS
jgi:hypothetical protein